MVAPSVAQVISSVDPQATVALFSFGESAPNSCPSITATGRAGCAASDVTRTGSSFTSVVPGTESVSVVRPGSLPETPNVAFPSSLVIKVMDVSPFTLSASLEPRVNAAMSIDSMFATII